MLSTTSRVSLRGTALPSAARRAPATAPRTLRVLAYEEGKSTGGETGTAYAKRLPGVTAPTGFFDPLGLSGNAAPEEINRWREAEVTHGRVAMLGALGMVTAESFHPLFGGQIEGPAIFHFQQIPAPFWQLLTARLTIGILETRRARIGWQEPTSPGATFKLRPDHAPGDYGWDPLGLYPSNDTDRKDMQTKELNNGRLAMLAMIPFVVREELNNAKLTELWPLASGTSPTLLD